VTQCYGIHTNGRHHRGSAFMISHPTLYWCLSGWVLLTCTVPYGTLGYAILCTCVVRVKTRSSGQGCISATSLPRLHTTLVVSVVTRACECDNRRAGPGSSSSSSSSRVFRLYSASRSVSNALIVPVPANLS